MKSLERAQSKETCVMDIKDYVTVKQLIMENPAFTEGGIRSLIFHADSNGFRSCIRRIGRRILISRSALTCWIESQNNGENHGYSR